MKMMRLEEETDPNTSGQVEGAEHVGFDDATTIESPGARVHASEKTHLSDKKYLVPTSHSSPPLSDLNAYQAQKWRQSAVIVSWVSIIATLIIGITELVVSANEGSTAAFGLGFSALLDVISSMVVLWRFYEKNDTFSAMREHMACAFLGFLFIISSVAIAGKGIYDLLTGEEPDMSPDGLHIIITSSIVASCGCLVLFCLKVVIAKVLSSWTIFTDAMNSIAGAIIAFSMVITSELTKSNPFVWFLDATVGLCVSVVLLIYGLWLLLQHLPAIREIKA